MSTGAAWYTAKSNCEAEGAWLATVSSASVQNLLYSLALNGGLSSAVGGAWIGFNDISTEGNFVWDHGETVSYTNWYPGEPGSTSSVLAQY